MLLLTLKNKVKLFNVISDLVNTYKITVFQLVAQNGQIFLQSEIPNEVTVSIQLEPLSHQIDQELRFQMDC